MASTHKTFQDNEILTASDVNNALNPTTADHIPRAVATGRDLVPAPANDVGTLQVSFPTGRFSSPPTVVASIEGTSRYTGSMSANVNNITATSFELVMANNNTSTGFPTVPVRWIAVQM